MTTRTIIYKDQETGERIGTGLLHEWPIMIIITILLLAAGAAPFGKIVNILLIVAVFIGYTIFLLKRGNLVEYVDKEEWCK